MGLEWSSINSGFNPEAAAAAGRRARAAAPVCVCAYVCAHVGVSECAWVTLCVCVTGVTIRRDCRRDTPRRHPVSRDRVAALRSSGRSARAEGRAPGQGTATMPCGGTVRRDCAP